MSGQTILSFGEILWDLLPSGEVLGGAPFNFAYRIHSLKYPTMMISRIGIEEYGDRAWDRILQLGMDTQFIQRDEHKPTGTVRITLGANNEPDYFIVPNVAYDFIECMEDIVDAAAKADCICFGTLAQRNEKSRATLRQILANAPDALKILDINLRKNCFTDESVAESLQLADLLKLNQDEAAYLSRVFSLPSAIPEFCAAAIGRWSLSQCVVTLGDRGSFAQSSSGEAVYAPGYAIQLVDPCGSGDAFTAGFIDRYFRGKSLSECCRFGNALGARVAAQKGATAPVAPEEIHEFLDAKPSLVQEESFREYLKE